MKLCLIGSTRFKTEYEDLNRRLSLAGHLVYSVACFGNSGDKLTDAEKRLLDLVHLQKIVESDAVLLVTDSSGYFGDSTKREIMWAKMLGKDYHSSQFPSHISHLIDYFANRYPCYESLKD